MKKHATKIICIAGSAGHGKDTAANFMKARLEELGQTAAITHFADLLKYICRQFFDWDGNKDEHGRSLLQYVGTDVVRKKNPNFWVGHIASLLEVLDGEWDFVLIPDCRFPNEVNHLRDNAFNVSYVRVERPLFESGLNAEQMAHPSETAMKNFEPDHIIYNNSTLSAFEQNCNAAVNEILNTYKRGAA